MTLYSFEGVTPHIEGNTWIAPDANVIGNVRVHAGASIWFGSTLRGDNEPIVVGPGSNVQEGCIFHTDPGFPLTIGANCTVGHGVILHGCTLGDLVLVGMGATVMNGAVIGAGSLIGAGALVTEGTEVPPNSLVLGAPGKVVRSFDYSAMNLSSAKGYQDKSARFRDGMKVVG
ncbi:MAG: gamma carbonic anhydrase family protein [Rhodobacteraceae bacterium]|nr:gamma carbonic anhydrase family protein [Paracoccaceae bacterium]